jgi:hypothetical protein
VVHRISILNSSLDLKVRINPADPLSSDSPMSVRFFRGQPVLDRKGKPWCSGRQYENMANYAVVHLPANCLTESSSSTAMSEISQANHTVDRAFGNSAVISRCGRYRYLLTRRLGSCSRTAVFIMLNPSTADAANDDPTIRRCIGFARQWGCGRLAVLNLFAARATQPAELKRIANPVGPRNPHWFGQVLRSGHDGPVVCAWGMHGEHRRRDLAVTRWLARRGITPLALGITRDGHPRHPIYVPSAAALVPFSGRCTVVISRKVH